MKRKTILALTAALALFACDKAQSVDGYTFDRKEFTHLAPQITFVEHPSQAAVVAAAPAATRSEVAASGRELMAWSILRGNACEVHMIDPAVAYKPEWIGHEIAHCVYGRWHP